MSGAGGGAVRVARVRSRAALREFIEFPYRLHARTAHWIPPLRRDQRILLDRLKHPFHDHAQVEYFLAERNGRTVGRVAAIENFAHNSFHGENIGFFGFLDAEDDADVFGALLAAAEDWARGRGLSALRGPCSFSTNEECGLLVENFDDDPMLMMPYSPAYYRERVEACGYAKAEDLLCYWLEFDAVPERIQRLADGAQRRLEKAGVRVRTRPLDTSRWDEEIDLIKRLYNKAWEKNWGFIPMTDREMDFTAKELKPLANPKLIIFAEIDGETAGMALAMPDYNQVLKHLGGKLGIKQIVQFLWRKRRIAQMRLLMMGVLPQYRAKGIEMIMYRDMGVNAAAAGIHATEMSWVLESNEAMSRQILAYGSEEYRRYRIFEKRF